MACPSQFGFAVPGWLHRRASRRDVQWLAARISYLGNRSDVDDSPANDSRRWTYRHGIGAGELRRDNGDKVSRTQLPPAVQQQIDQSTAQASESADQAAAQAQQTTPEQKAAEARQVGQRAAKGGAVGTGAATLRSDLGALAAAFGGKTGGRYPVREVHKDERRMEGRYVAG